MKSYRRFLVLTAAVLLGCFLLLFALTGSIGSAQRDPVLLNDIVCSVKEHIAEPETLGQHAYPAAYWVFGSSGSLLYASPQAQGGLQSTSEAMQRGYLCMAVTEGSQFLGTVAMQDPSLTAYQSLRTKMLSAAAIAMVLLFVTLAGIGLYLRRRIVAPFRKMQKFAENIAQGRLDDPLIREEHNLFGSFTESFDIMREELREARRREDAMKLREKELAAALSHDIKTPVTGIKLICEVLSVRTEDPYLRTKIGDISAKAEQIHVLANDLLNAALDDLGEMRVNCQDVPSSVLPGLLEAHDPRGLVRAEAVPECMLFADTDRLSQVLGNLISNSYKYADTPISVRYAFEGDFLRMEISDKGGGIPEDEIDLITTKFYRGKANSGGKEGSGLGLYISNELMHRMDGQLRCENRSGGLTVTLMLRLS